jgi:hypothetical protein
MSIFQSGLWTCGFDMQPGLSQIFTHGSSGSLVTTTTPFTFGFSTSFGVGSPGFFAINGINFNGTLTTHFAGFYLLTNTMPTTNSLICQWFDITGNAAQVNLRYFNDGHLQFYSGGSSSVTTLGPASATGLIPLNTFVHIEPKVVFNATTGSVQCRINGTNVIPSTGSLNTVPTGNVWAQAFDFVEGPAVGTFFVDDVYMLDGTGSAPFNTFLGPCQCRGDAPNANSAVGGRNAWTNTSTGSSFFANFVNVGQLGGNANKQSDYNFDTTPGDYDMFRYPSLPSTVSNVFAVNTWSQVELDSAGIRTVSQNCYSSGTDSLGAAFTPTLTGSPSMYLSVNTTDPHTSSTWTVANAQAAELGVKLIS